MGVISIIWGVFAMLGACVAFIPFLGWMNWINIPFSTIGVIFAAIALANPRSRDTGIAGLTLGLLAIIIGYVRLTMGFGIF
jgi:hypothetical protein